MPNRHRPPNASEQLHAAIVDRLADGPPPARSPVTPTEQLALARRRHDLAGAIKATLAAADQARGPARAAVTRQAKREALEAWFNGLSPEQQEAASDPAWVEKHGGRDPSLLAEVVQASAYAGLALTEAELRNALSDFSEETDDYASPYHPGNVEEEDYSDDLDASHPGGPNPGTYDYSSLLDDDPEAA